MSESIEIKNKIMYSTNKSILYIHSFILLFLILLLKSDIPRLLIIIIILKLNLLSLQYLRRSSLEHIFEILFVRNFRLKNIAMKLRFPFGNDAQIDIRSTAQIIINSAQYRILHQFHRLLLINQFLARIILFKYGHGGQ